MLRGGAPVPPRLGRGEALGVSSWVQAFFSLTHCLLSRSWRDGSPANLFFFVP